jgi:hypothetical protein
LAIPETTKTQQSPVPATTEPQPEPHPEPQPEPEPEPQPEPQPEPVTPAPKKRGRKPGVKVVETPVQVIPVQNTSPVLSPTPKKRGRKPKAKPEDIRDVSEHHENKPDIQVPTSLDKTTEKNVEQATNVEDRDESFENIVNAHTIDREEASGEEREEHVLDDIHDSEEHLDDGGRSPEETENTKENETIDIDLAINKENDNDENHDNENELSDEEYISQTRTETYHPRKVVDPRRRVSEKFRRDFVENYVNSDDEPDTEEGTKMYEKFKNLFKFYRSYSEEPAHDFVSKLDKLKSKLRIS